MKLWTWEDGRQKSGYRKLTLLFSTFFGVDAYILHIPVGVSIPQHVDLVPDKRHYRLNVTIRGRIRMETSLSPYRVFRLGDWFSFFRPDVVPHSAPAVTQDTYLFSIGWVRK